MAAPHGTRRLLWHLEEEARADHCFGQRGTRPRLPHQWLGKRIKPAINEASPRQGAEGPPPVPRRGGDWENQPRSADIIEVERQIAELVDRSTQDLRVAWRELHRTELPQGLSRDLLIRALAHRLQEQSDGGTSRAQRRRLQTLAREFEKGSRS